MIKRSLMTKKPNLNGVGIAAALLIAGTLLTSTSAAAREHARGERSAIVQYGDLDLTREAGMKTLYSRLERAAKRVCRPYGGLSVDSDTRWDCISTALSDAIAGVNDQRDAARIGSTDPRQQSFAVETTTD